MFVLSLALIMLFFLIFFFFFLFFCLCFLCFFLSPSLKCRLLYDRLVLYDGVDSPSASDSCAAVQRLLFSQTNESVCEIRR